MEGSEIKTAREMGWQRLSNGELLEKANGRFDVLVTMDKAMPSQQVLQRYSLALVIIKARSNRIAELKPIIPRIQSAIADCARGTATSIP